MVQTTAVRLHSKRPAFASILVASLVLLAILLIGILLVFVRIAVTGFETQELYARSAQFQVFLDTELQNLSVLVASYAEWPDMARFFDQVDGLSPDSLYSDGWLQNQRIDYVALIDSDGRRLWTNLDRQILQNSTKSLSGQLPAFGDPTRQNPGTAGTDPYAAFGELGQDRFDRSDRRFFPDATGEPSAGAIHGYLRGNAWLYLYAAKTAFLGSGDNRHQVLLVLARRMDPSRVSAYLASPHIQAYFQQFPPAGMLSFPVQATIQHGELVHYQVVTDPLGRQLGAWSISLQRIWLRETLQAFGYFVAVCLVALFIYSLFIIMVFKRRYLQPLQFVCRRLDAFLVDQQGYGGLGAQSETSLTALCTHIDELTGRIMVQNGELARLAGNDGLTGLPNRRKLEEYVSAEVKRMLRRGYDMHIEFENTRHAWLAFVMIDIDWFKQYNEHYGHPAGDACLRDFAMLLREAIKRPSDFPCRLGGDSFGIVLPETNEKGGLVTARRVLDCLEERRLPHSASLGRPYLSASFGVAALLVDEHFNLELLMAMADRALLAAKEQGRNRVAGMFAARP